MTFDKHFKLPKYMKRFMFTEVFNDEQRRLYKEAYLTKLTMARASIKDKTPKSAADEDVAV